MHLPQHEGRIDAFTESDRASLRDAVAMKADLVGLSFVRDADDLRRVRAELPDDDPPLLVAKIETRSAVENLAEIVEEADAVMVARGDLGIQTELPELPLLQKRIIRACNCAGKPVITATQMLESMITAAEPTRAEASDVANAILDGTSAIMLSGETAIGRYPVESVAYMDRIARAVEPSLGHRHELAQAAGRTLGLDKDEADQPVRLDLQLVLVQHNVEAEPAAGAKETAK